ncbi:MAG TPA: preprotein translocase subunit SecE [Myxococcota bacterium]|nr:preprotein translocase subunit SecE [Myxococcota bacterium]
MRARGTWVVLFFVASALIVATVLNYAFRDLFFRLQINNFAILGEGFRLSTLVGAAIALVLGLFFGVFYKTSRQYVEQCVAEFDKVAWPDWKETKGATFTVIVVSIIASAILGVFDAVFSWWTSHNLFLW